MIPSITKIDIKTNKFVIPEKKIISEQHIERFKTSPAYNDIMLFIFKL